jgi:hypothetical protein
MEGIPSKHIFDSIDLILSGLCPYCRRSKVKLYKVRTEDYDPKNRRLGDVFFIEKTVKLCCPNRLINDIYLLWLKKLKNVFAFIARKN